MARAISFSVAVVVFRSTIESPRDWFYCCCFCCCEKKRGLFEHLKRKKQHHPPDVSVSQKTAPTRLFRPEKRKMSPALSLSFSRSLGAPLISCCCCFPRILFSFLSSFSSCSPCSPTTPSTHVMILTRMRAPYCCVVSSNRVLRRKKKKSRRTIEIVETGSSLILTGE